MFQRFKVDISDIGYITGDLTDYYRRKGEELFKTLDKSFEGDIKQYLNENKELSADRIKDHWFPKINCDIFISHSHIDEETALAFSGWLYSEFEIVSFIDSKLWKYTNNLLKKIDNIYTINSNEKTYDYDKRNYSTSHAHVMLSSSLVEMIDSSECLLFIDGEGSSSFKSDLETNTQSPWIYTELTVSEVIRRVIPGRYTESIRKNAGLEHFNISESVATEDAKLKVNYSLLPILSKIPKISFENLDTWKNNKKEVNSKLENLDTLYRIMGLHL